MHNDDDTDTTTGDEAMQYDDEQMDEGWMTMGTMYVYQASLLSRHMSNLLIVIIDYYMATR